MNIFKCKGSWISYCCNNASWQKPQCQRHVTMNIDVSCSQVCIPTSQIGFNWSHLGLPGLSPKMWAGFRFAGISHDSLWMRSYPRLLLGGRSMRGQPISINSVFIPLVKVSHMTNPSGVGKYAPLTVVGGTQSHKLKGVNGQFLNRGCDKFQCTTQYIIKYKSVSHLTLLIIHSFKKQPLLPVS